MFYAYLPFYIVFLLLMSCTHLHSQKDVKAAKIKQNDASMIWSDPLAKGLSPIAKEGFGAVGRIGARCNAFHVGGGMVVTAASCLLGDLEEVDACRKRVCTENREAIFCTDDESARSKITPDEHKMVSYQSNIPPQCFARVCQAEIAAELEGAGTANVPSKKELIEVNFSDHTSRCLAIVSTVYQRNGLDFALLMVEDPPRTKFDVDREISLVDGAKVGILSHRKRGTKVQWSEGCRLSQVGRTSVNTGFCLECSGKNDALAGSPLLDLKDGIVIGVQSDPQIGGCSKGGMNSLEVLNKMMQQLDPID